MKNSHYILKISIFTILIINLLLISGCNSKPGESTDLNNNDFGGACWISDTREWPSDEAEMYGNLPAPVFRKEFNVQSEIKSALFHITAAGYYSAFINGERIGKNVLDPAWTNFSKRIYYSSYDITGQLKQGRNTLGTTIGNGFYNTLPMRMWGKYNLREELPTGKPCFIARLTIEYADGRKEEIITDQSWKHSFGPVMKNSVYLGEVYDAGFEIDGWKTSGFDDSSWKNAETGKDPGGRLQKAFFPPVRVTDTIKPVKIISLTKDTAIIDMGVNYTGLYRIRLKGEKGDTIRLRFGERLYENGRLNPMTAVCGQIKHKGMAGEGAPDIAWQCDSYIFGDETEAWYNPSFTFHIFRYIEVSGLDYLPENVDIEGHAINTDVSSSGSFTSSNELLNSVQEATRRTFLDNLISVQSDCPGREKFGYGGDLNATSESFIYNFDMKDFYRKTVYDWVDAMKDSAFIDTAPFVGIIYCGLSWESAFLTTQDKLLLYYNDTALVRELYPLDLKWMEKAAQLHPEGVVRSGLADHEALQKVPVELIGTTHYLDCARIMTRFAAMMGDKENEDRFRQLANRLKNMMMKMYWAESLPDSINKQTMFATLLYYDIVPEQDRVPALDSLLKAVKKGPEGHFTTGIFGTKYILEALSSMGRTEDVYKIACSRKYPGWGHMIDRGATTIWETWKESDNTYSNCHPMFGTITEWYYRWLGGIQPDQDYPGFKQFNINPSTPEGLDKAECSYQSPHGMIISNWNRKGRNLTEYYIEVPEGTRAVVTIPVKAQQSLELIETGKNETKVLYAEEAKKAFQISSGKYTIKTR